MDYFTYKSNQLFAEDVAILDVIKQIPTPFYIYSAATLRHHVDVLEDALEDTDHLIAFAVKTNSNLAVLELLGECGLGADTVSVGEIKRALRAGIDAQKIVYSGVAKTAEDIRFALLNHIKQINVESENELYVIEKVAQDLEQPAPIAFRVNPDVEAGTLKDITTGTKENKFGISLEKTERLYQYAHQSPYLETMGVATHIGSQIAEVEPFFHAWSVVADLIERLNEQGFDVPYFDLGGGLGIPYHDHEAHLLPKKWGEAAKQIQERTGCKIIVEPGRMIAGNAGLLISKVIYNKQGDGKEFVIIDAGMNDLARPAIYKTEHSIIPIETKGLAKRKVDVVGPICESTDIFAKDYMLEAIDEGAFVAFRTAGAYGAVMSNTYNSRPLVAEILTDGNNFHIIRNAMSIEDIMNLDILP
ncbi:MAG: diaminopimelate decarboxylase [Alphaproteobacteria bacterium]